MKNSRKLKIINWVIRILKYQQPIQLPLKEEKRQIQEVRWEGVLYEWDAEHELQLSVNREIAREMLKLNVVDYKKEQIKDGEYRVSARAFFIEPFERWDNSL